LWRLVTRLLGLGHLDKDGGKLYWCDREGMRVMRANLDGSQVERSCPRSQARGVHAGLAARLSFRLKQIDEMWNLHGEQLRDKPTQCYAPTLGEAQK
jgi:hypothetical protein